MPSDLEIAWLAGLFEGEGTISRAPRNSLALSIKMIDEDIIRRACAIAGCGSVRGPYMHGPHAKQPQWTWAVSRRNDILRIVEMIGPWLGARRTAQAKRALDGLAAHPARRALRPRPANCDVLSDGEVTNRGAHRHVRAGELPCDRCAQAQRLYLRERRAARNFYEANA